MAWVGSTGLQPQFGQLCMGGMVRPNESQLPPGIWLLIRQNSSGSPIAPWQPVADVKPAGMAKSQPEQHRMEPDFNGEGHDLERE